MNEPRHWHPYNWSTLAPVSRIRVGDVIHNPVYVEDNRETRALAERVDAALAERGLKLDHTQFCINFVELAK